MICEYCLPICESAALMIRSTARSDTAAGMYNRLPFPSAAAIGQNTHGRSLNTTGVVCHFVGYALPIQSPSIAAVSRDNKMLINN
jgi:hypothetical protein